jgi:hypothetical protein
MKRSTPLVLTLAASFALLTPVVHADDDTDSTTVVAEGQQPDDAVTTLALPDQASDKAKESAASGLETANAARELHGNETAADARELGREFGERTAEEARDSNPSQQIRETAGDARSDTAADRLSSLPERPSRH